MLGRDTAERPEGVLQAGGQRGKAFASQHDLGMLPSGESQPEMVEPVHQRHAGDRHIEASRIGEVRQPLAAGQVLLAEDHLTLGPVQRLPAADTPLKRPPDARRQLGMPTQHLLIHRERTQAGRSLQHWHDFGLPNRGQGIGSPPAAWGLFLGRKPGIAVKPGARGGAEAGAGGRDLPDVGPAMVHVESRLLVGDVRTGHGVISAGEPRSSHFGKPHAIAGRPRTGAATLGLTCGWGTPILRSALATSILITAQKPP